jgi:hypothetical protein
MLTVGVKNRSKISAEGTGFTSVFGLLTEAYFSCLRTAAEPENSKTKFATAAAHGSFRNIFNCNLNCFLILCLGASLKTLCQFASLKTLCQF